MGRFTSGFSTDLSSMEMHSTPLDQRKGPPRQKKTSMHRRHHFSLPRYVPDATVLFVSLTSIPFSLSLGKDETHALSTWRNEMTLTAPGEQARVDAQ